MFHTTGYKSDISGGFNLPLSVCTCRLMASGRGSVLGAVETTRILTNTTPSIRWTWNVQDRCSSNSEDPGQTASCNQSPDSERHLETLQQLVSVFRVLQTVQRWFWDGDGVHCGGPGFRCLPKEEQWRLQVQPEHVARVDNFSTHYKIAQTVILQFTTGGEAYFLGVLLTLWIYFFTDVASVTWR